jgi:ABC-type protease/lipase transport system fused ATPase/permease subunit
MAQSMSRQSFDDMTGSSAARPRISSLLRLQQQKQHSMNLPMPQGIWQCSCIKMRQG